MKVVLRTDMLTLTTPLEQYLTEHVGSLDTTSPDLWAVYTAGLDELYAAAPSLDGVLVRIGEAGRVYDVDGWDYYSSLAVTTVDAVRAMLTALTGQAERTGRDVIFRSWSVGVGAVGDMHTNPDSYAAVLDGIDSPALVVSTKYTLGDFYSHLPLNETLLSGSQRRIVEFQSRREFESYGAFPNDLGAEYRDALQRLLAANPHIEGVWAWTQDGGPWRAGPMTLYLKAGFWQLYELNTVLAGSLARDPDADVGALTADWARRWFSDDPATVRAVTEAMAGSREAVTKGLYIGPFAEQKVRAIGLEPPPMMWIFEWDILTGDSAVLDVISSVTGDRVDEAVTEGREAVATAERMRDPGRRHRPGHLARPGDARGVPRHPRLRGRHAGAAGRVPRARAAPGPVARHRVVAGPRPVVRRPRAVPGARGIPPRALPGRRRPPGVQPDRRRARHRPQRARPGDGVAGPGPARARRGLARRRGGGRLPSSGRGAALGGRCVLGRRHPAVAGGRGRPRDAAPPAGAAGGGPGGAAARHPGRADLVPRARAPARGARGVAGAGRCRLRRCCAAGCRWGVVAAAGGVLVARCALALLAMSSTGPGGYWYAFWTEPGRRTVYVTVAVAPVPVAARGHRLGALGRPWGAAGQRGPCSPRSAPGWRCRPASSGRSVSSGRSRRGTTRSGCCRGGSPGSSGSRSTSASPPTPRGGPPGWVPWCASWGCCSRSRGGRARRATSGAHPAAAATT